MASTETITIRCEPEFKHRVTAFCETQGRSVSDLLTTAAERQMAASCEHCGRSDRPTAGAGLSEPAEAFFASPDHGVAGAMTITVAGRDLPVAYNALRQGSVKTHGMLSLYVEYRRTESSDGHAPLVVPRGLITGWEDDPKAYYYERLVGLGYRPGNHSVIRAAMRAHPASWVPLRALSDRICERPGVSVDDLARDLGTYVGDPRLENNIGILRKHGIVDLQAGGGLVPKYRDPDDAVEAMLRMRLNIDS
jgi:hypothetical protein